MKNFKQKWFLTMVLVFVFMTSFNCIAFAEEDDVIDLHSVTPVIPITSQL